MGTIVNDSAKKRCTTMYNGISYRCIKVLNTFLKANVSSIFRNQLPILYEV